MECPNCGAEVYRITFDANGASCEKCNTSQTQMNYGTTIVRGFNKHNRKMTHADFMHIKTRKIGKDGLIHSHPRWESSDY